jgi:hypothetical protein
MQPERQSADDDAQDRGPILAGGTSNAAPLVGRGMSKASNPRWSGCWLGQVSGEKDRLTLEITCPDGATWNVVSWGSTAFLGRRHWPAGAGSPGVAITDPTARPRLQQLVDLWY